MIRRIAGLLPSATLLLIVVLTYWIYAPGLHGPFLLDDDVNLQPLTVDTLSAQELRLKIFNNSLMAGLSRSLGNLTFTLTQFASGYDPYPYKYQNLLLHLINGLLLFWLFWLLLTKAPMARPAPLWLPLLLTSLWLLHPLQVSTVLYAVQRYVLLSALFSLLLLIAYVKARLLARKSPVASGLGLATAFVILVPLAMTAKENAVLVFPAILLVEWLFFGFKCQTRGEAWTVFSNLLAFVVLPILVGLGYFFTHFDQWIGGFEMRDFTAGQRLLTQIHVIWFYVKLILIPIPGSMSLFHDNFPVQTQWGWRTLVLACGLVVAFIGAFLLRKRQPLIGFGILWFLLWHSLEGSILNLELVFEHRNYLALAGIMAVVGGLLVNVGKLPNLQRLSPVIGVLLVGLLAANTAARAMVWGNKELLVMTEYAENPRSPRLIIEMFVRAYNGGDILGARKYSELLQDAVPENSYPYLLELLTYCKESAAPPNTIAEAIRLGEFGRVTPGVIHASRDLMIAVLRDQCPGVTLDQAASILLAVDRNRLLDYAPAYRSANFLALAFAFAQMQDWERVEELLRGAVDLMARSSIAEFSHTIDVAAAVAGLRQPPERAVELLQRVTEGQAKRIADLGISMTVRPR